MEEGYCDNIDCDTPKIKQTLYLTVLHKEFDYDICWWCENCIKNKSVESKMVYMSELNRKLKM